MTRPEDDLLREADPLDLPPLYPDLAATVAAEQTRRAFRAFLGRITYKPGWTFGLTSARYLPDWALGNLRITYPARDTYHPEEPERTFTVTTPVPPYLAETGEPGWTRWLYEAVLAIERHEAGEWFRLDSHRPYDPHAR